MKNRKGNIWILIGLLLLGAALCLTFYNIQENEKASDYVNAVLPQLTRRVKTVKEDSGGSIYSDSERADNRPDHEKYPEKEMPIHVIDGVEYVGTLEIPALNLVLPIISQWDYPSLRMAPCRYEGSAYLDNLVIAGHNYASHFGNLDTMIPGEEIFFTDCAGNRFAYEIVELETLGKMQVEEMIKGDWDLTLFTCTYGGQSREALRCIKCE